MPTITRRVAAAADDGSTGFGDLDFGVVLGNYYGDLTTRAFLRFVDIDVPKGSMVTAATLTLRSVYADPGQVRALLACEDADDPAAPLDGPDLMARVLTTARSLRWTVTNATWNAAVDQVSPSIVGPIQEVIDRPGWQAGNALALIALNDTSTTPYAEAASVETDPASAGLLTVTYDPPVEDDATAPIVALADPTPGAQTPGYEHVSGVVTLRATAADDTAVTAVDLHDGDALIAVAQDQGDGTWTAQWDTTATDDGPHRLTARATDAAGNSAVTDPLAVLVANGGTWAGPGLPARTVHS